jgi:hypothetical protein
MKKIKITLMAVLMSAIFISGDAVYASFPVKKEVKKETTSQSVTKSEQSTVTVAAKEIAKVEPASKSKLMDNEMLITLLLWVLLWPLAAHRWYKKKPVGINILFILTFGGCGIWALVDLINIVTDNF